jgi:hypothetical protein
MEDDSGANQNNNLERIEPLTGEVVSPGERLPTSRWNPPHVVWYRNPAVAGCSIVGAVIVQFFNVFLQMRGYVNLAASRVVLAMMCGVMIFGWCIYAFNRQKRQKSLAIVGSVIIVALLVGLDRITLPSKSALPLKAPATVNQVAAPQPRLSEQPKIIPHHTAKQRSTAGLGREQPTVDPITDVDPDVKLLSDAERLCIALEGWHDTKIHQRIERENQNKNEIADRHLDQQGANAQMGWVEETWWSETLPDYQQTFVPELLRTRRLMLAVAPEAAGSTDNWIDPGNSGGITGVEHDFAELVKAYRAHLQTMGKVTSALTSDEQRMDPNGLRFIFSGPVESGYR